MSFGRRLRLVVMLTSGVLATVLMAPSTSAAWEHAPSWSATDDIGYDAGQDQVSSPDSSRAAACSGDAAVGLVARTDQSVEVEHSYDYRSDFARPPPVEVGTRSAGASAHLVQSTSHHFGPIHRALLSVEVPASAPSRAGVLVDGAGSGTRTINFRPNARIRIAPGPNGTWDLVTLLTKQ